MLKTTVPLAQTRPAHTRVNKNESGLDGSRGVSGGRIDDRIVNLSSFTKKKSSGTGFLILKASLSFTQLKKAFIKDSILYYFDPKCHIRIETNTSGYVIDGVLSQLTTERGLAGQVTYKDEPINPLSEIDQQHPITFFFQKMILVETRYKTHDQELLALVEAFKTWYHYLKGYKYKVLVLTDYNNLRQFMDTKSLSSRQVRWVQKLSHYHFQIDYYQCKANRAVYALSRFLQSSTDEKTAL